MEIKTIGSNFIHTTEPRSKIRTPKVGVFIFFEANAGMNIPVEQIKR